MGLVGCADQSFISETAGNFIDEFQRAESFEDSNEPQTNRVEYELGAHDIKEVEDVPLEELEEFDLTGPQNYGILKTDTNTAVGNATASVSSNDDPCIYIYTAGNPEGGDDGIVKGLHVTGNVKNTVILPANEVTLEHLTDVKNTRKLKYSADDFQKLLVEFTERVDAAYVKGRDSSSGWCGNLKDKMLDVRWDLLGDLGGGVYIEYKLGDETRKGKCTGYCEHITGVTSYVTLDMLYKHYGLVSNTDIGSIWQELAGTSLETSIDPDSKTHNYTKTNAFVGLSWTKMPLINSAVFTMYSTASGKKLNAHTGAGNFTSFALQGSFTVDSAVSIDTSTAKELKEFGGAIGAECGAASNVKTDKDNSSMYHSGLSAAVEAIGSNACVFVSVSGKNTKDKTTKISVSDYAAKKDLWTETFDGVDNVKITGDVDSKMYANVGIGVDRDIHCIDIKIGKDADADVLTKKLGEIIKAHYYTK